MFQMIFGPNVISSRSLAVTLGPYTFFKKIPRLLAERNYHTFHNASTVSHAYQK